MNGGWNTVRVEAADASRLARELGVSEVTARCLWARGVLDKTAGAAFLTPQLRHLRPPDGLPGLSCAIERLVAALRGGQTIGVFGDYDVDGVTSAALFAEYLGGAGARVVAKAARRDVGYGFGAVYVEEFRAENCQLVIIADCGTRDVEALTFAKHHGLDCIVVDHHTVPEGDLDSHPAYALINPFRVDTGFPFRGLASVGLAFYTMAALRTELRRIGYFGNRGEPDLLASLDLVALGTVADVVTMTEENRVLVSVGLRVLARRGRAGMRALLATAEVASDDDVSAHTASWRLAPRLNAPGRMGTAQPALELLLAADDSEAVRWMEEIERLNDERRVAQDKVLADVAASGVVEGGTAIVVSGVGWAPGVVGIVAGRLAKIHDKPVFVIAVDESTGDCIGSARSARGVHLVEVLSQCAGFLQRFGGHGAAAGFLLRCDDLDAFRTAVLTTIEDAGLSAPRRFRADARIELLDLDERIAVELALLGPFGPDNEEPTLLACDVLVTSSRRVGDGSHLKLGLAGGGRQFAAIGFGLGALDPGADAVIDVVFTPKMSMWRGTQRLELHVKALELSARVAAGPLMSHSGVELADSSAACIPPLESVRSL